MEKPVNLPEWATKVGALVAEPTQSKKEDGWTTSTGDITGTPEKPSLQSFNWWMLNTYENLKYLDEKGTFDLDTPVQLVSNTLLPTLGGHVITGEGGLADDLEYIDRTNILEGDNLVLMAGDLVNPVTIKHAATGTADRIFTVSKEDYVLDTNNKFIVFKRIGDDFYEILRAHPSNADFNPSLPLSYNLGSDARKWLVSYIETMRSNNIDTPDASGVLNIGDTDAGTINIGRTGATVALYGDIFQVVATETIITDKKLLLNSGGLAASADDTGFEIEEDSSITGYIKTSADRASFLVKPPASDEFIFNAQTLSTIGEVKHSVLTVAQFTAIHGDTWKLADGQAISRTTYSDLFAYIGTTYGPGDGVNTFELPDLQQRYLRGSLTNESDLGDELDDATDVNGMDVNLSGLSATTNSSGTPYWYLYTEGIGNITNSTATQYRNPALFVNGDYNSAAQTYENFKSTTACNSLVTNVVRSYSPTGNQVNCNVFAVTSTGNANYNVPLSISVGEGTGSTVSARYRQRINSQMSGVNYTTNVSGSSALSSTDSETRPKTLVLNAFIKVK